jgi:hypothetical protein
MDTTKARERIKDEHFDIINGNVPKIYIAAVFIDPEDNMLIAGKDRDKVPFNWIMDGMMLLADKTPLNCLKRQFKEKYEIDLDETSQDIRLIPGTFWINEKDGKSLRVEKVFKVKISYKQKEIISRSSHGYSFIEWKIPGEIISDEKYDNNLKKIATRIIEVGRIKDYANEALKFGLSKSEGSEFARLVKKFIGIYEEISLEEKSSI